MNRIVGRYEVPVDGRWHEIPLSGNVFEVAARDTDVVEFWAYANLVPTIPHRFKVFGTGHPVPDDVIHIGTALTPGGSLVWHLMEEVSR